MKCMKIFVDKGSHSNNVTSPEIIVVKVDTDAQTDRLL